MVNILSIVRGEAINILYIAGRGGGVGVEGVLIIAREARRTFRRGQCRAQPIFTEQFATGRGGPRGAEEGNTDGLVRGGTPHP